jgi:single-strand DNA-binding protein
MSIEAALFGVLGRDAERKTSGSGKNYVRLNLRVGDGDGAQWISVLVFGQEAVDAAEKLTKGARVYVEGKLSISEWSGSDGAKRHGLSVMSWHCRLAEIGHNRRKREKPTSGREAAARSPYAPDRDLDDDIPF